VISSIIPRPNRPEQGSDNLVALKSLSANNKKLPPTPDVERPFIRLELVVKYEQTRRFLTDSYEVGYFAHFVNF
jgi:hypothetical protein